MLILEPPKESLDLPFDRSRLSGKDDTPNKVDSTQELMISTIEENLNEKD